MTMYCFLACLPKCLRKKGLCFHSRWRLYLRVVRQHLPQRPGPAFFGPDDDEVRQLLGHPDGGIGVVVGFGQRVGTGPNFAVAVKHCKVKKKTLQLEMLYDLGSGSEPARISEPLVKIEFLLALDKVDFFLRVSVVITL